MARHCFICTVNLWADTAPPSYGQGARRQQCQGAELPGGGTGVQPPSRVTTGGAAAASVLTLLCGLWPTAWRWVRPWEDPITGCCCRNYKMPINSTAAPRVQKRLQALVRHSNMLAYLSSFINHTAPFHPPRKLKGCPMWQNFHIHCWYLALKKK